MHASNVLGTYLKRLTFYVHSSTVACLAELCTLQSSIYTCVRVLTTSKLNEWLLL